MSKHIPKTSITMVTLRRISAIAFQTHFKVTLCFSTTLFYSTKYVSIWSLLTFFARGLFPSNLILISMFILFFMFFSTKLNRDLMVTLNNAREHSNNRY